MMPPAWADVAIVVGTALAALLVLGAVAKAADLAEALARRRRHRRTDDALDELRHAYRVRDARGVRDVPHEEQIRRLEDALIDTADGPRRRSPRHHRKDRHARPKA